MPKKDDPIPVYFLGYPGVDRQVITLVKDTPYGSPIKEDGSPDIGGMILVRNGDVAELINKNRFAVNGDPRVAYTLDATLAALVKDGGKAGEAKSAPTADEILSMLTPEQLEERIRQLREGQKPPTT
jgi:hypothetical protein